MCCLCSLAGWLFCLLVLLVYIVSLVACVVYLVYATCCLWVVLTSLVGFGCLGLVWWLGFWLLVIWWFGGLVVSCDVWVVVYFGLLVELWLVWCVGCGWFAFYDLVVVLCCVVGLGWLVSCWQFALVFRVCLGFLDFVVCFVLGVCDLF